MNQEFVGLGVDKLLNGTIKQPVAETSIKNDPLTLRVPVDEAESDRLLAGQAEISGVSWRSSMAIWSFRYSFLFLRRCS